MQDLLPILDCANTRKLILFLFLKKLSDANVYIMLNNAKFPLF